jgi:hypothetical protein
VCARSTSRLKLPKTSMTYPNTLHIPTMISISFSDHALIVSPNASALPQPRPIAAILITTTSKLLTLPEGIQGSQ